jgi:hypothetical protein
MTDSTPAPLVSKPIPTMDWKHIALGALSTALGVLIPVELHYLQGIDWASVWPAGAPIIMGILHMANEYFTNQPKGA